MDAQNQTTPAATKPEKKNSLKNLLKKPKDRKIRVAIYLVAIVVILVVTNPSLIPFLPATVSGFLTEAMIGLFGNVTQISKVITINWVSLFQLAIMVIVMLLVKEGANWLLEHYNPTTGRAKTVKNLIVSTLKYVLAIVGIFWGLSILGVDVSTLFASVGVLALIIGFGAESLIADVVTGLFMIFENQYNVGDIIELDGYRGTVVNIAIRTTSIEDTGGNIKIFNNSDVRNIINLSNESSFAVCDIPVPYEADLDQAEKVIQKLCDALTMEYPEVFHREPEYLGVQQLAPNYVVLRISAKVQEEDRFDAARLMNKKMKTGLEAAGMGVPHANLVVCNKN